MNIDPNVVVGDITWANAMLWVLGVGGFIFVLDSVGLLPEALARWLARNRLESTLKSLRQLGVRVSWEEDTRPQSFLQRALAAAHITTPAYEIQLGQMLVEDSFDGPIDIGRGRTFISDGFIDVMGGSTSAEKSRAYARILNTYAVDKSLNSFDVVATPKSGSPILGYEFSKIVDKPLVLGVIEKVTDKDGKMGAHAYLDFPQQLSLKDKKILIVDDSTTGGRKVIDLAKALRKEGAIISDALVLFEPKGKNARAGLQKENITLHSIVEGPKGKS